MAGTSLWQPLLYTIHWQLFLKKIISDVLNRRRVVHKMVFGIRKRRYNKNLVVYIERDNKG